MGHEGVSERRLFPRSIAELGAVDRCPSLASAAAELEGSQARISTMPLGKVHRLRLGQVGNLKATSDGNHACMAE